MMQFACPSLMNLARGTDRNRPAAVVINVAVEQSVFALAGLEVGGEARGAGPPGDIHGHDQLIIRQIPDQEQTMWSGHADLGRAARRR